MTNAIPESKGNSARSKQMASSPPADAPIPVTIKPVLPGSSVVILLSSLVCCSFAGELFLLMCLFF